MSRDPLYSDFLAQSSAADRLRSALLEQVGNLVATNGITLGVPMEGRVKTWGSICEKVERKALSLKEVADLDDLVGIRVILLFRPDLARVDALLRDTFSVLSAEDTFGRLDESQFGYQSRHYVITLPKQWLTIPSFSGLGALKAEVQVRTLAQHIWAAASHKLQYKHEATVPPPLRRSIHRVSALLETVDLEFERLLGERATYVHTDIAELSSADLLNVDVLQAILLELLPERNRADDEEYAELLRDIVHFDVATVGKFKDLLRKHLNGVLVSDAQHVAKRRMDGDYSGTTEERIAAGVFYTHVGLAREALCLEFGTDAVRDWLWSLDESDA